MNNNQNNQVRNKEDNVDRKKNIKFLFEEKIKNINNFFLHIFDKVRDRFDNIQPHNSQKYDNFRGHIFDNKPEEKKIDNNMKINDKNDSLFKNIKNNISWSSSDIFEKVPNNKKNKKPDISNQKK